MIQTQSAAGDHAMDMRMVGQRLSPRMKNGEKSDFRAEVFWVSGYRLKGGRRGGEQKVIEHRLILKCQWIELFGDGEDDVIVVDGQQFSLTPFYPLAQEL